jgi:hypothetical protein
MHKLWAYQLNICHVPLFYSINICINDYLGTGLFFRASSCDISLKCNLNMPFSLYRSRAWPKRFGNVSYRDYCRAVGGRKAEALLMVQITLKTRKRNQALDNDFKEIKKYNYHTAATVAVYFTRLNCWVLTS